MAGTERWCGPSASGRTASAIPRPAPTLPGFEFGCAPGISPSPGRGVEWAAARGQLLGEAHEAALKEAETDAMKRALTTFGNLFGLALYDKEQAGVRGAAKVSANGGGSSLAWIVLSADGRIIATCGDPKTFCTRLRQAIVACSQANILRGLWNQNAALVTALRDHRADLVTRKGIHFAVLLERVYEQQLQDLTVQNDAGTAAIVPNGEEAERLPACVDKTALPLSVPRRLRDRDHLKYVATLPCVVCGRVPSQAHHLRFAQPRALGLKVSDEWVVPLCNIHHRALHDVGDEERWWKELNIDAAAEAERLWQDRHVVGPSHEETAEPGQTSMQERPAQPSSS